MTEPTAVPPQVLRTFRETADPTRWRLFMLLGFLGPMKAGSLARLVDVSDAVVRRHLEVMADVGLVEVTGEGRNRRWQRTDSTREVPGLRVNEEDEGVEQLIATREFGEWLKVVAQTGADLVQDAIDDRERVGPEWFSATEVQEYVLYLSRDELAQLSRDLQAAVRPHLEATREHLKRRDAESRPIYVSTHAVVWPSTDGSHPG